MNEFDYWPALRIPGWKEMQESWREEVINLEFTVWLKDNPREETRYRAVHPFKPSAPIDRIWEQFNHLLNPEYGGYDNWMKWAAGNMWPDHTYYLESYPSRFGAEWTGKAGQLMVLLDKCNEWGYLHLSPAITASWFFFFNDGLKPEHYWRRKNSELSSDASIEIIDLWGSIFYD